MSGPDFEEFFRKARERFGKWEGKTVTFEGGKMVSPKRGILKFVALGFVVFLVLSNCLVIIGPGLRGVVLNFGAVQSAVWGEGLHLKVPFYQSVVKMEVRVQKEQTAAAAASKDLQDTSSTIAVNFHVIPEKASWVFQNIGLGYRERIIDPVTQEVVKGVTAKFTAVELITTRERVRTEIRDLLRERLLVYNIYVDDLSIVDFKFSQQFTNAIEAKQTAEQLALKAQRDLERVKIEAQQKITQAQAEAEALRLQRQNVTAQLVELRRIEAMQEAIRKWNGILPSVTSGAMPFIDVRSYTAGK